MHANWPIAIDKPEEGGDAGYITFADMSTIHWNWDDGQFECEEVRLEYPWGPADPIFNPPPDFKWRWVFEGNIEWNAEDSGTALVDEGDMEEVGAANEFKGMTCRIGSYDPDKDHTEARPMDGRRVRITVEVLPNPTTT